MMYDYIIVTHIPAFYKVNLYNELAKSLKIFVIFIASNTAEKRADDFVTLENAKFKYEVFFDGNFQERNVSQNISRLKTILKNISFKNLLVSGWDLKEFWYLVVTNPKSKNCLALESTINESRVDGIRGFIKKIFLSRISTVFASGKLHIELLNALGYKGEIKITKGVGIINKPTFEVQKKEYKQRFLYIGRLSPEKNLRMLIEIFNTLPNHTLTLVGTGHQESELKDIAKENIIFTGQVENTKLQEYFLKNDIFILPSIAEPWGLVVEEALYFGLPVMVSRNCGSVELLKNGVNGFIFNPLDKEEIKKSILSINGIVYEELIKNLEDFSITKKDLIQVSTYV